MEGLEKVGDIWVDSGQVLIVDPCYLSKWEDDDLVHIRGIRKGNKSYQYGKDFQFYDDPLKEEGDRTPNDLVRQGWEFYSEYPQSGEFSYSGVSQLTCEKRYGQLEHGAVGSSTGLGDGCYPVYAKVNSEGRVEKLIIEFMQEE